MPQGTWQVSNFIEGKRGQAFSGLLASGICSKKPVQHARLHNFHWNVSRGTLGAEQKSQCKFCRLIRFFAEWYMGPGSAFFCRSRKNAVWRLW